MGIELEKDLQPSECLCYQIGETKEAHDLMCFRKGIIGTLTDNQESKLCSTKDIRPPTKELKERIAKFTEAIHSAQERYHKEGIDKWLELVSEETKKRGIEL